MKLKVWIGAPGFFKQECEKLLVLLKEPYFSDLSLSPEESPDFDWILALPLREASPAQGCRSLTLLTSGTTGAPKKVTKDFDLLVKEKRGSGSNNDKWLLTYNPARWAGMSVLLHCLKFGCSIIFPNDLSLSSIAAEIPHSTHISFTPSFFRKLQISGMLQNSDLMRQVSFGGEACSQNILDSAKQIWPKAKISHILASTEFGDLACASDGLEGFSKLPGYLAENGELFIGGKGTGDYWIRKNNRYYYVGRKEEIINVGGNKVSPFEIEKILYSFPEIKDCVVYGVSSPIVGHLVCADYVGEMEPMEVYAKLQKLLPKFAIPRLKKVSKIMLSQAWKVRRP